VPRLGIITGLESEARCFARWQGDCQLDIARSGADSARASILAQAMASSGCDGLVSFGLAGGLHPDLHCGDLVLPETVICGSAVRPVDEGWRDRLFRRLGTEFNIMGGAIAGSYTLAGSPEEKAALRRETGAIAVDMESRAVAGAGLPFVVVRVIADTHDKAIPDWATNVIGADGKVFPVAVVKAIFANPGSISRLFSMATENREATTVLRRVATLVQGDFGFA